MLEERLLRPCHQVVPGGTELCDSEMGPPGSRSKAWPMSLTLTLQPASLLANLRSTLTPSSAG